jgi:catalase
MSDDSKRPPLSHASGTRVTDNLNIETDGARLAIVSQDQSPGVAP